MYSYSLTVFQHVFQMHMMDGITQEEMHFPEFLSVFDSRIPYHN
jgi:hypothetical protein